MNLNDSNIFIINRDIVLLFIAAIVVFSLVKLYKVYNKEAFTTGWSKYFYINVVEDIYIPLVIITILRAFFLEMYMIPSGSMQPSLYPGDFVIVNKLAYGVKVPGTNTTLFENKNPKVGDIVVFLDPKAPTERKVIKRLVAAPGDKVVIDGNRISINGQHLQETFQYKGYDYHDVMGESVKLPAEFYEQNIGDKTITVQRTPMIMRDIALDFVVPAGHYFVMGDNRENSEDSRFWGFVPERLLCGKALGVVLSVGKTDGVYTQKRVGFLT